MDAAQKHADCRLPELQGQREDTWSSLYRFFERGDGNTVLNRGITAKTLKIACNWSSWARPERAVFLAQIGFPGWKDQVHKAALKRVREATKLISQKRM
jgi:hypothetical protein